MPHIATLPAGRYNIIRAERGAYLSNEQRKSAIGGRIRSGELYVCINDADVVERGEQSKFARVGRKDSGPFDRRGRPAALVELAGYQQVRSRECFDVQTSHGPLLCNPFMAIVPVDEIEHDRLSNMEYRWIPFESDTDFEVTYDDMVLRAGPFTLDLRRSFDHYVRGVVFGSESRIFKALDLNDEERLEAQFRITPERIAAMQAIHEEDAQRFAELLVEHRTASTPFQLSIKNDGTHLPKPEEVHFRLPSGRIIRAGTPAHSALKIELNGRDQVRGGHIDRPLADRIEALGGQDAFELARALRYDMSKGYDTAIFIAVLDKMAA